MRCLLFTALLLSPAPAQGILPLSDTFRFADIGSEFNVCDFGPIPDLFSSSGTIAFDPNGSFDTDRFAYTICGSGATDSHSESGGGIYQVRTDGLIQLDGLPALPGAAADTLNFRADGGVATLTREFEDQTDAFLAIAIALSSGQTNASLAGTYFVARLVLRNDGAHSMRTERVSVTFNGAGGFSEVGSRHSLAMSGTPVDTPVGPSPGSYSVDDDGTLTVGMATGAVSPDGEVFFWNRMEGPEIELTVGVRKRPVDTYFAQMLRGEWGVVSMEHLIGMGVLPDGPELATHSATFSLTPQNATSGTVDFIDLRCETLFSFGLTSCDLTQDSDVFSMSPGGLMDLGGIPAAVSSDGTFFLGCVESDDGGGLLLGVSRGRWPTPIGTATPGSAGYSPGITAIGGFPYAGNPEFGLVIAGGLGGAPAALVFSSSPAAPPGGTPMFGGTVWIDPSAVFASIPLTLSGPAAAAGVGAAGIPMPIPGQAVLGGTTLYIQGVVIDPGAPAGFAFTRGLDLTISR